MGVLLFILLLLSSLHVSFAWFLADRFFNLPENTIIPGSSVCAEIQILARFCFDVSSVCAFFLKGTQNQKLLVIKETNAFFEVL